MHLRDLFRRPVAAPVPTQAPEPAPARIDLAKFDDLTPAEVMALPRRLRSAVYADRLKRMTAHLRATNARRGRGQ